MAPYRFTVCGHPLLAGMDIGAPTIAAVIEDEDVEPKILERCLRRGEVAPHPISPREEQDGKPGIAPPWCRLQPLAGKLRLCRIVRSEADQVVSRRHCALHPDGMKHRLPLSTVEKEAQRQVDAGNG